MATKEVFEEHLSLISALKDNYARSEDRGAIAELLRLQNEIVDMLKTSEDRMNASVQELTSGVEEAAGRATYPKAAGEHEAAREAVLAETAAAKENVNALNEELKGVQAQREALRAGLAALRSKGREIEELVLQTEPQLRHALSLYAHVSRISWDFGAAARVAGTVSNPVSADILPFDLAEDPAALVETADRLWELMGA